MPSVKLNLSTTKSTFVDDTKNPPRLQSDVILLGVACDLTASYNKGTWFGPQAILDASHQIEYEVPVFCTSLTEKVSIHNAGIIETPQSISAKGKPIHFPGKILQSLLKEMTALTKHHALHAFQNNQLLLLLGGEHSIPNGVWQALETQYAPSEVAILQFDAHLDLRDSYHDTPLSHACIMRRARDAGFRVIQVGVRDHISQEEADYIRDQEIKDDIYFRPTNPREMYHDHYGTISHQQVIEPKNLIWENHLSDQQINDIVQKLSKAKHVWISIDVDCLDASDIPGTGTPLPFGISRSGLRACLYRVIKTLREKNIHLAGFDINEVSPQLRNPAAKTYSPTNTFSTASEMDAALLAYYLLFWNYLDRFT